MEAVEDMILRFRAARLRLARFRGAPALHESFRLLCHE
jgi:hypothetical protein